MRRLFAPRGLVLFLALFLVPGAGFGQFTESFDGYPDGSPIIDQAGWEGWEGDPALTATVSAAEAASAPNSLSIQPTTDVVRSVGIDSGAWTLRAKVFIPSTHFGTFWFLVLNQYVPGTAFNWSAQVRFADGRVSSHGGSGFFSQAGAATDVQPDGWVELRIDIDLESNTQTVYYGGELLHETAWIADGLPEIAIIDLFSEGSSEVFVDDIVLEAKEAQDCDADGVEDGLQTNRIILEDAASAPLASNPIHLVTADFNGDGDLDLAVAEISARRVSVLFGAGDAALSDAVGVLVRGMPFHIAAGDLTGDGAPDIITGNQEPPGISYLRNDGDGAFTVENVALPERVFGVELADIDGDQDLDVLATGGTRSIWTFINEGGVLSRGGDISTGAFPNRVAAADLDADGDIDLVTAANNPTSPITIHPGEGGGAFAAARGIQIGEGGLRLALADLDRDGDVDIAGIGTGNPTILDTSSLVFVLRNRGTKTLDFDPVEAFPVGSIVEGLAAGDVDGDGRVDLVAAGFTSFVWVLPSGGPRGFRAARLFLANDGPTSVALADLDGDRKPEVLVTNINSLDVSVLRNRSAAVADDCNADGLVDSCQIAGGTIADANANGVPDVCEADGDGDGVADLADNCPTAANADQADADADGIGDACDTPGDGPRLLRGDCNGEGLVNISDAICILGYLFTGGGTPACLASANVNGDGAINISDASFLLSHLFLGGAAPAAPFPSCGTSAAAIDVEIGCVTASPACN